MSNQTTSPFKSEPYWLLHHGVLLEWTTEPVEKRIEYIKREKPESEIPIRLKWLRPVKNPGRLPKKLLEAGAECAKAYATYAKAYATYAKAYATYAKAYATYAKARAECAKAKIEYAKAIAEAYAKAYATYAKARAECAKAEAECDKAYAVYAKTSNECMPDIITLHKEECPGCPFDYKNGELIFSTFPF